MKSFLGNLSLTADNSLRSVDIPSWFHITTTWCHSVRLCHSPWAFYHERWVATGKTVLACPQNPWHWRVPVHKELWFRGDELRFRVPSSKTVPALYPEAPESQVMPHRSSAKGFLVGLLEWTCIQGVNPHIDWPREQTVGTHVNVRREQTVGTHVNVSHHTTAPKYCGLRGIHSRRTPSCNSYVFGQTW